MYKNLSEYIFFLKYKLLLSGPINFSTLRKITTHLENALFNGSTSSEMFLFPLFKRPVSISLQIYILVRKVRKFLKPTEYISLKHTQKNDIMIIPPELHYE